MHTHRQSADAHTLTQLLMHTHVRSQDGVISGEEKRPYLVRRRLKGICDALLRIPLCECVSWKIFVIDNYLCLGFFFSIRAYTQCKHTLYKHTGFVLSIQPWLCSRKGHRSHTLARTRIHTPERAAFQTISVGEAWGLIFFLPELLPALFIPPSLLGMGGKE